MTTNPDDDRFLDDVAVRVRQLEGCPVGELLDEVRSLVQRTMIATLPDGSWPDSHVVQEALHAYLDVADAAEIITTEDRRWLDATRQCANSVELLDDVLSDLRADVPQRGPNW